MAFSDIDILESYAEAIGAPLDFDTRLDMHTAEMGKYIDVTDLVGSLNIQHGIRARQINLHEPGIMKVTQLGDVMPSIRHMRQRRKPKTDFKLDDAGHRIVTYSAKTGKEVFMKETLPPETDEQFHDRLLAVGETPEYYAEHELLISKAYAE